MSWEKCQYSARSSAETTTINPKEHGAGDTTKGKGAGDRRHAASSLLHRIGQPQRAVR